MNALCHLQFKSEISRLRLGFEENFYRRKKKEKTIGFRKGLGIVGKFLKQISLITVVLNKYATSTRWIQGDKYLVSVSGTTV